MGCGTSSKEPAVRLLRATGQPLAMMPTAVRVNYSPSILASRRWWVLPTRWLWVRWRGYGTTARTCPATFPWPGSTTSTWRDLTPALTTVRLPLRRMGESALTIALEEPDPHATSTVRWLSTELLVRDSTGPAPTAP